MKCKPNTEPKATEFEVHYALFGPRLKFEVWRRINMGSETVACCYERKWARLITRLLEKYNYDLRR